MTRDSSSSGGSPRVLFWLVWIVFWGVGSLVIVGGLHRDNNYGVRPGDYSLRTIDSTEFAELAPEQQMGWDHVPGSEKYIRIIIKSPFIFAHVRTHVLPILLFAMVGLVSYLRWHGLPSRTVAVNPSPTRKERAPTAGVIGDVVQRRLTDASS